ncbi:hypothetical protein WICMUC_001314 [Wickerhamomyces mucosus]|uniref:SH3 domain-containing protein n=1 Tax=Wickerhamomyces mucosus TaxID=1378264 RepID=A0A9P8THG2_9ASCO|nr:hypothetical protein WICMUC_001314 [Wickerhamomyces mucosus]
MKNLNISIKDFAYESDHELHYCLPTTPISPSILVGNQDNNNDSEYFDSISNQKSYNQDDSDEINTKAIALFEFEPENENEIKLIEGQLIWINYRYGQGWLVAQDLNNGETGLIPEEYVQLIFDDDDDDEIKQTNDEEIEEPKQVQLFSIGNDFQISNNNNENFDNEDDWTDEEEEEFNDELEVRKENEELPNLNELQIN